VSKTQKFSAPSFVLRSCIFLTLRYVCAFLCVKFLHVNSSHLTEANIIT